MATHGGLRRAARWMPSRNQVVRAASGERAWRGAFTNRTDRPYRDVAVEIRFLDPEGRPVGRASGRAERLEPGARLDLHAPLPPEAAGVQVWTLRWRAGEACVELGPYAQWSFGHLQA